MGSGARDHKIGGVQDLSILYYLLTELHYPTFEIFCHYEDMSSILNGSCLQPLLVLVFDSATPLLVLVASLLGLVASLFALVASLLAPVAVSLAALAAALTVPQAAPANSANYIMRDVQHTMKYTKSS